MNGVLIINKPEGITSHDTVARCRRVLRTKRIGHTGTLDPFATGVMVILVGQATRLARFLDKDVKEYEAVVRLGFETETGDRTGSPKSQVRSPKSEVQSSESISIEKIQAILPEFCGEIEQTPPMYSAKKIEGKKLYELARKGIEIERKPQKVKIYELELLSPPGAEKTKREEDDSGLRTLDFGLKVLCSAGTYIRVLAEDIGKRLGMGAHLAELKRTRAGKFALSKAVTLEKLEEIVVENRLTEVLISMNDAVLHLAEIRLSPEEINKTKNGLRLKRDLAEAKDREFIRMTDESENLVAIGFYSQFEKTIQPKIVLI